MKNFRRAIRSRGRSELKSDLENLAKELGIAEKCISSADAQKFPSCSPFPSQEFNFPFRGFFQFILEYMAANFPSSPPMSAAQAKRLSKVKPDFLLNQTTTRQWRIVVELLQNSEKAEKMGEFAEKQSKKNFPARRSLKKQFTFTNANTPLKCRGKSCACPREAEANVIVKFCSSCINSWLRHSTLWAGTRPVLQPLL